jgi:hypothetical protein
MLAWKSLMRIIVMTTRSNETSKLTFGRYVCSKFDLPVLGLMSRKIMGETGGEHSVANGGEDILIVKQVALLVPSGETARRFW